MASNRKFPEEGRNWDEIQSEMIAAQEHDLPWHHGRSFKPTYYVDEALVAVQNAAFDMYISHNALYGGSAYPSLRQYEEDVMDMTLEMLNAPEGSGGSITTGGTESNIMAVKTARDWARENLPDAHEPEIVLPRTGHPSFDKGAHLLGVKVVRMDESPDFQADVAGMAAAINENTIMLVGSAPPYPYGTVDPITEIAALAREHGLWMHVDGCLGGFVLPFAREIDPSIPPFDFEVPGVTSISADVHKYGYAVKGASTISYVDDALKRYEGSYFDAWPSGTYATSGLAGSRTGGSIASAWAVMRYLGREGYLDNARKVLAIKKRLMNGVEAIEGFEIVGNPHSFHFAFCAHGFDVEAVADGIEDRGWHVSRSMEPPSIQLIANQSHGPNVEAFLTDLGQVTEEVRAGRITSRGEKAVYAM